MPSIGLWELVVIFMIVLIVFGPKALPRIGHALGKGIKDFKDATKGLTSDFEEEERERERRRVESSVPRESIPGEKVSSTSSTPQA